METVNLLFSTVQTSADLTPMEHRVISTDDIPTVSLEKIERVRQSIRQTRPINPQPATVAAIQHKTLPKPCIVLPDKPQYLPLTVRPLPTTIFDCIPRGKDIRSPLGT